MITRTTHADALHQYGRHTQAEARFRETEEMQATRQPNHPVSSLRSFQYCDLRLAAPERRCLAIGCRNSVLASPRDLRFRVQISGSLGLTGATTSSNSLVATCRRGVPNARHRVGESDGLTGTSLLDIALDYLTLARAELCASILDHSAIQNIPNSKLQR